MGSDFFASFLGTLGAGGVLVLVLRYLSTRFVEQQLVKALADHQHALDLKLATLQASMSRLGDLLSRRNEREFAVVEGAWELLINALGSLQSLFSPGRPHPGFGTLSQPDALVIIHRLPFAEADKDRLRASDPAHRDELYSILDVAREYPACFGAWGKLKAFLNTRQIILLSSHP